MATIIEARLTDGIYYVTYESGAVRKYEEAKLPKTVLTWMESNTETAMETVQECPGNLADVPQNEAEKAYPMNYTLEAEKAHTGQNRGSGAWASEAVMFGLFMTFAVAWFIVKELAGILTIAARNFVAHVWENRGVYAGWIKEGGKAIASMIPAVPASRKNALVIVRLIPVVIWLAVLL